MNGVKLGFSMVDLAKSMGRGIGSIRLKDGSSVKILGDPNDSAVDIFRIKHGRLLEARGYRGEDTISHVANDIGYIEEHLAQDPADVDKAWMSAFDVVV